MAFLINYMSSIRTFKYSIFALLLFALFSSCNNSPKTEKEKTASTTDLNLAELNSAILKKPGSAQLYFQRAKIFLQKNVQNQAFSDLQTATKIDSSNTEYLMLLGDVAFKSFQIKKTSDTFEKVVQLDPKNKEAYLKLAELYFYIKGYQRCLLYTNEALKIDDKLVKAYSLRGFAYKEMGDTAKAVSSFNTVLDLLHDDYDTYIQLGNIYSVRTNPLALQYYNNALRLEPNSTEAYYNRGLYYQNRGEVEKATNDYLSIIKIDPSYADAFFNLGFINSVMKDNCKEAIPYYSSAIQTNDQYAEAYFNRGLCYEKLGDLNSARKDFKATLGIIPTYKAAKLKLNKK